MKYLLSLLFIFCSLNIFAQKNKNQKASIATNIYCSHCQECETCGSLLHKNMLKIKGVKSIQIDAANNTINVVYNENKTSLSAIKNALAASGYDADEVKANIVAYEKLDGCCKKK